MKSCQLEKENQGNFLGQRIKKKGEKKGEEMSPVGTGEWASRSSGKQPKHTKFWLSYIPLVPGQLTDLSCHSPAKPGASVSEQGPVADLHLHLQVAKLRLGAKSPNPWPHLPPSPLGLDLWKAAEQFGWKDAVWVWGALNTLHDKISSFQNGELT